MFKRKHRLAKNTAVMSALKTGRGFFNPAFVIRALPKAEGYSRFAVVVSTKVDKRATRRNRLKRILREFLRTHLSSLMPADYVIMLKPLSIKLSEPELLKSFEQSLKKWKLLK